MKTTITSRQDVPADLPTQFGTTHTAPEHAQLRKDYEETLFNVEAYDVVEGIVVDLNDRDVVVSINAKADGLVPRNEFRDLPDVKSGDKVEVYIEELENAEGNLILSRKKAKLMRGWEKIKAAAESQETLTGQVVRRTKGGLIVSIYGIEAFLPGSQIDTKPIRDFDAYVNQSIDVVVLKINHANDNVVVSHKVLIERSLEDQRSNIISHLERGQILEGSVKNMTSFGAFVDLGGVDGLLHITDIVWTRVNHPEEVLQLGQKVKVVVLDFNEAKKRIALGMKQLTQHPWDSLVETIEVGAVVKGKVVNVADYGAFVEIMPGVEGLIHISEMSWTQHLHNVKDFISLGDEVEAKVLTLDRSARKMALGIKQLTQDPWLSEDLSQRYAVGTKHHGIVKNMTHFGVFVELEKGIEGLLHISDLSWTRRINHPSELLKGGERIDIVILEIDMENKKLLLGYKQLQENPWETYAEVLTVGSTHQGTVSTSLDKGALIKLNNELEGFAPKYHLTKEDGTTATAGELLLWKVIEFDKHTKKLILSHKAVFSEVEESRVGPKSRVKANTNLNNHLHTPHKKATLGDIDTLVTLKERIHTQKEVITD